jgi:hypothetical protein
MRYFIDCLERPLEAVPSILKYTHMSAIGITDPNVNAAVNRLCKSPNVTTICTRSPNVNAEDNHSSTVCTRSPNVNAEIKSTS